MISTIIKTLVKKPLNLLGFEVSRLFEPVIDNDQKFLEIYDKCKEYTMTPKIRMYSLYNAVKYIVNNNIPGEFIECGVWKGGNTMLIALTLKELGTNDRQIYLYDTFEGMTEPSAVDTRVHNTQLKAHDEWEQKQSNQHNSWCYSPLEEVQANMESTGYPKDKIVYVKGKVEDTIPNTTPEQVALLRLDTDWYSSTKHELVHLFPKLSINGILIIDDYGCWAGSKKAVDEFFADKPLLLHRIDNDARIIQNIKLE